MHQVSTLEGINYFIDDRVLWLLQFCRVRHIHYIFSHFSMSNCAMFFYTNNVCEEILEGGNKPSFFVRCERLSQIFKSFFLCVLSKNDTWLAVL